jgi:hypothetical protein
MLSSSHCSGSQISQNRYSGPILVQHKLQTAPQDAASQSGTGMMALARTNDVMTITACFESFLFVCLLLQQGFSVS